MTATGYLELGMFDPANALEEIEAEDKTRKDGTTCALTIDGGLGFSVLHC